MKKIFLLAALCALTMGIHATTYNYLCGITELTVDSVNKGTKRQYTLSIKQTCKNINEYGKTTTYASTVKLVLISDDCTLEGTYTTEGANPSIDIENTELKYSTQTRVLRSEYTSTFTIAKVDKTHYAVIDGDLSVTRKDNYGANIYNYSYSYDVLDILMQDIQKTPYVFGDDRFEPGEYLCGIAKLTVDTLAHSTKNQYTLNFTQKSKNTAEYYSKPNTVYTHSVKLVINSNDRTLEGTYTTNGASSTSSSANENDQTINLVTSEMYCGATRYLLRSDSISTFTITKVGDKHYAITTSRLHFTDASLQYRNLYTYSFNYSYDRTNILEPDIPQTPFEFNFSTGYTASIHHYDMTVNGINVIRDDTDFGKKRYLLTLSCSGKNRETNSTKTYEVQLAIYPDVESIVGSYSTQGSAYLLYSSNCYIKDSSKKRYLANDSLSTVQIKEKGTNQYSFYGGTLICADIDANYSAVYGKKRIESVHYYHFSDNGGAGIEFGYDESNKVIELTPNSVIVDEQTAGGDISGFQLVVKATSNGMNYRVDVNMECELLAGSFTVTSGNLTTWTKVSYGDFESYIKSGSTISINKKSGNTYTISGNLLCENGYTYSLKAFDFQYGTGSTTGVEEVQSDKVQSTKVLRDGKLIITRDGKAFNAQGARVNW